MNFHLTHYSRSLHLIFPARKTIFVNSVDSNLNVLLKLSTWLFINWIDNILRRVNWADQKCFHSSSRRESHVWPRFLLRNTRSNSFTIGITLQRNLRRNFNLSWLYRRFVATSAIFPAQGLSLRASSYVTYIYIVLPDAAVHRANRVYSYLIHTIHGARSSLAGVGGSKGEMFHGQIEKTRMAKACGGAGEILRSLVSRRTFCSFRNSHSLP